MSGLYGHLNHLYENHNLTFKELKEIFNKLSSSQLECYEKSDGINIYLSYSVKENSIKIGRNKTNIKFGGLTQEQLVSKYSDKPFLVKTFQEALNSWNLFLSKVPAKTKIDIFGENANKYYNFEIQDPNSKNVIQYDEPSLILHKQGHFEYTNESFEYETLNHSLALLEMEIRKIKNRYGSFNIVNKLPLRIKISVGNNKAYLTNSLCQLENLQQRYSLKDSNSIKDFLHHRVKQSLRKKYNNILTPSAIEHISNKLIGTKGIDINKILDKISDNKTKENIKEYLNNSKYIYESLIEPVETLIHEFGVNHLRNYESSFIKNNASEITRLRKEVNEAISAIKNSSNKEALSIFERHMKKLKSVDNINSSIEGIVFEHNNQVYKLTGNFAPINQILGLMKFGRGQMPPLSTITKESAKNRIIAAFPGGFKPPHGGHYEAIQYLSSLSNVDKVIVIISPKSRFDRVNKKEITAEQSFKIWKIFSKNNPKVDVQISKNQSPIQDVYKLSETMNPGDTLVLIKGDKDIDNDSRFENMESYVKSNNLKVNIKEMPTKVTSRFKNGASFLRELIVQNNMNEFSNYMPQHLSLEDKKQIWEILSISKRKTSFLGKG